MNDGLERHGGERWHLSKAVPLSIIGVMTFQTIILIIWASKLDSRVGTLETNRMEFHIQYSIDQKVQNDRLVALEGLLPELAVIKDRQENVIKRLDVNASKLDKVLDNLNGMKR